MHDKAVVVLAGGLSTRMGNNKLQMLFKGKPMLIYTLERLNLLDVPIYVSIHKKDEYDFTSLPYKILEDIYPSPRSPLLGILSSFKKIEEDKIFVISADSPEPKIQVILDMLNYTNTFSCVIPMWPSGNTEAIHAAYNRTQCLPFLEQLWRSGKTSVKSIIKTVPNALFIGTEYFRNHDPELLTFRDFDTPEDLRNYLNTNREAKNLESNSHS